jgi:hypothetical protein
MRRWEDSVLRNKRHGFVGYVSFVGWVGFLNRLTDLTDLTVITGLTLLLAVSAHAAPSLSSIAGTLSNGNSVTISGSGFGTKTQSAPAGFDRFEGTAYSALWSDTLVGPNALQTGNQRHPFSARNMHINFVGSLQTGVMTTNLPTGRTWFTAYWFYLDPDWTWGPDFDFRAPGANLANVKIWRMGAPAQNGDEDPILSTEVTDLYWFDAIPDIHSVADITSLFAPGTWHHVEWQFQDSTSAGAADGSLRFWIDGNEYIHVANVKFKNSYSDNRRPYGMSFWNSWNSNATDPNDYYQDDTYIDNSWARVYLCPGATFVNRGKCELQPPAAWNSASITVTLNQGALISGQTVYAYVVDTAGNVNAAGFQAAIGGSAPASTCDLNNDSATNVSDVQICANQAIGTVACSTGDINKDSACNVVDVQRTVNAALGGQCVTQ